jgi:hypothetical protein
MTIDTNSYGLQVNAIVTPQRPKTGTGVATTANTNYTDTPTNTVAVYTAGPNGARITKLSAMSRATVTATELQLFRSLDAGTTRRFFRSKLMPAYTVAATTEQTAVDFAYSDANPLILGPNEVLYGAIGVTQTGIVFTAEGADY